MGVLMTTGIKAGGYNENSSNYHSDRIHYFRLCIFE